VSAVESYIAARRAGRLKEKSLAIALGLLVKP